MDAMDLVSPACKNEIAIMQPTFLPWIGYFSMMDQVETYVFLDSVDFAKRSWQQRNQVKTVNGPKWITIPVISKGLRGQKIFEVTIDRDSPNLRKLLETIKHNYKKAKYFDKYFPEIAAVFEKRPVKLADFNIELILTVAKLLKIKTPNFYRSSDLNLEGAKSELLCNICESLSAGRYLSAPGSREYIEAEGVFNKRGIEVSYLDFKHPSYPQLFGEFQPYMSTLDLLFNVGPESAQLIKPGS